MADFKARNILKQHLKHDRVTFGNIILPGDSITQGNGSPQNYKFWLDTYLPGIKTTNLGLSGCTPETWMAEQWPKVFDIKPFPDTAIVMIGTNCMTLTQLKSQFPLLIDLLVSNNIRPIIVSITPRGDGAAANPPVYNNWIRYFCYNNGIPYIDIYAKMLNSDGSQNTNLFKTDKLHPIVPGHQVIAKNIADNMPGDYKRQELPWFFPGETNLQTDPTMSAITGWSQYATTDVVYSKDVSTVHSTEGNWITFTKTSGPSASSSVYFNKIITTTLTEGATYRMSADVDTSTIPSGDQIAVSVQIWNTALNSKLAEIFLLPLTSYQVVNTRLSADVVIPANAAKFTICAYLYGVGTETVRLGRISFTKIEV